MRSDGSFPGRGFHAAGKTPAMAPTRPPRRDGIPPSRRKRTITMRKILLGLVASAAIAAPLAVAGAASADSVPSDPTCVPVKHVDAWTETLYKSSPVKTSDGPTQWPTENAPAGTHKTYVVKGKNVDYMRDGTKTNDVVH